MITLSEDKKELTYDKYVKNGSLMQLREGLGINDPNHLYNYLKNSPVLIEAEVTPEDFGIFHPSIAPHLNKSKEELLSVITDLVLENKRLESIALYHERYHG